MKKTKILIPALSIAGLGAAIAPMAAMTSCSCNDPSASTVAIESEWNATNHAFQTKGSTNFQVGTTYVLKYDFSVIPASHSNASNAFFTFRDASGESEPEESMGNFLESHTLIVNGEKNQKVLIMKYLRSHFAKCFLKVHYKVFWLEPLK